VDNGEAETSIRDTVLDVCRRTKRSSFIGPATSVHPDFGGTVDPGPPPGDQVYGMPYIIVTGSQPKKTVTFVEFPGESDGVGVPFYPIPDEAITTPHWIESGEPGNQNPGGDRHMLIVDQDNKLLYELYHVFFNQALNRWEAGSGAFFDMKTNNRRPEGWTSADAAGLAILPGLVRYDEAYLNAGPIKHAFRMTVRATNGYVYPASHLTCDVNAGDPCPQFALPMGARLRLKPNVIVSSPDPGVQRVVEALKTYGLIVADNGSDMFVGGTFDDRWDNDILNSALGALHASDFQVIQLGYNPPVCPPPALSIDDASVPEGNSGTTNTTFTVTLSAAITPACPAATVSYATANGTATAGSDYGIVIGTLSFPPGVTAQPITVPVMADRIFEGNETFFVNLSGPVNATIADGQGVGTTVEDDPPGLSVNDVTAVEGATAAFTVTLSPVNPKQQVTVQYQTADGTATAASGDYQAASGTLTFPVGTATQPVNVVINADALAEGRRHSSSTCRCP
jgi:Calx-beta domain